MKDARRKSRVYRPEEQKTPMREMGKELSEVEQHQDAREVEGI